MTTLDDDKTAAVGGVPRRPSARKTWLLLAGLVAGVFVLSLGIRIFLASASMEKTPSRECFAPLKCKQLPLMRATMENNGDKT
ncbi:MAG: hypothetical protein D8H94_14335 [Cardiobacterium sp.]|nr:MAG: hypothetical protein D8H94_14335 [Cardiobacterium sp.]